LFPSFPQKEMNEKQMVSGRVAKTYKRPTTLPAPLAAASQEVLNVSVAPETLIHRMIQTNGLSLVS
jgi:hypothetical protein